jgi:transcriptional regulator of NAD metabolism
MKSRLNITIEESVLRSVKYLAEEQNTSVSELVENYFKTIIKPKKTSSLSEIIKALPKPKLTKDFNWKEEYYQAKKKKYGL